MTFSRTRTRWDPGVVLSGVKEYLADLGLDVRNQDNVEGPALVIRGQVYVGWVTVEEGCVKFSSQASVDSVVFELCEPDSLSLLWAECCRL